MGPHVCRAATCARRRPWLGGPRGRQSPPATDAPAAGGPGLALSHPHRRQEPWQMPQAHPSPHCARPPHAPFTRPGSHWRFLSPSLFDQSGSLWAASRRSTLNRSKDLKADEKQSTAHWAAGGPAAWEAGQEAARAWGVSHLLDTSGGGPQGTWKWGQCSKGKGDH